MQWSLLCFIPKNLECNLHHICFSVLSVNNITGTMLFNFPLNISNNVYHELNDIMKGNVA